MHIQQGQGASTSVEADQAAPAAPELDGLIQAEELNEALLNICFAGQNNLELRICTILEQMKRMHFRVLDVLALRKSNAISAGGQACLFRG
jgi:hypothetical protein